MLRDPALIPLSQQHHNGLALCVLTERALQADRSEATIRQFAKKAIDRYEIELTNHFAIEEQVLFPLIERELGGMLIIKELIADHRALERMIGEMRTVPSADLLLRFCDLLRRHIRREENELFQDVQQRLPAELLAAAGKGNRRTSNSRLPLSAMRIALIQMNSRANARDENVSRACEFIAEAARSKPDVVVLPEFFNTEYFPAISGLPLYGLRRS